MSKEQENLLEKAKKTLNTLFGNVVPADQVEAMRKWALAVETQAPPAGDPATPSNKEVKTKDGKTLSIEGDIKVDAPIKELTVTGPVDLADGDYVLVDEAGTEMPIKVEAGKIKEVTAPTAPQMPNPEAEMAKQVATLTTQLSEQKTANEKLVAELKTELADVKKQVVTLSNHLIKIIETPINLPEKNETVELSALEKHRMRKAEING